MPAQAGADRRRGELAGPARRLQRGLAERQPRGERRGVGAAGAVRGAVGMARARDRHRLGAVEEEVGAVLGVAAGDDDRVGPERLDRRAPAPPARVLAEPASARAPRRGSAWRRWRAAAPARPAPAGASRSSSTAPLSATITGSSDDRCVADQPQRLDHRVDRLRVAEHPDLDRVDADVLGDHPHLLDDHLRRDRLDRGSRRPCSGR